MIRHIIVILLIAVPGSTLYAQELTSRRAQADRLFDRAEYFKSLNLYLKLAEVDNPQVAVLERVADCYRLMNNYEQAEDWYSRLSNTKGINPQDIFYYAEVLLRNKKIDKARDQYRRFFATGGSKDQLDFKVATCDSAAAWMKLERNYKVTDERKINSVYSDWGPFYNGKTGIIFTSDRSTSDYKGDKGIYARTGTEWLKLFNYDFKSGFSEEIVFGKSGNSKPIKFRGGYSNEFDHSDDDNINLSKDYHTGPICLNASGDTAYITVTTRLGKSSLPDVSTPFDQHLYIRRLELMVAIKKNNKWVDLKRFPYNNVSSYSVGHAALSKNGQTLYFTSDMPGGQGKTDIWYCQKTSDGKWGQPVNCGKTINTAADEAFPSIGGDDKLYFASRGLPGMGGYDIFSSVGSGSSWTTPLNLRYPLNSTSDDFCFITQDGKTGYMSSDRQGGQGNDDIYSFIYTGKDDVNIASGVNPPVNPVNLPPMAMGAPVMRPSLAAPAGEIIPAPVNKPPVTPMATPGLVILEGGVFDNTTKQGLDSVYITLKNKSGETIGTDMAMRNKKFFFRAPPGQEYTIEASKKGFYPASQKVSLKNGPVTSINTNLQMTVEPLAIGKTFVIRNIYYDLNRATIRPDAIEELQRLVEFMKDNPSVRIELSSHTDSRGPDNYNMLLSEARATSAVNYLRHHGIAVDRMVAKGYGETRLLNNCGNGVPCSEEDHQFNRRTEIKIIGGAFNK